MKARNFLTNAAYRRFKEEKDFKKQSFVTDIAIILIQNLNPIAVDRKLETDTERNHVKMIWDKCLPQKFTLFILIEKNYLILSETQVTYQKAIDILNEFLEQNQTENFDLLKESLVENINLIRYVYSTLFSKIYNRANVFGIRNKSNFDFSYQLWKSSKTIRFEHKLISIDKFQLTVITVQLATSNAKTTKEIMDVKLEKKREKRAKDKC